MKMFRRVVAALLFALLPSLAAAQTDGRISGTVRDTSGAFVAGATVKVRNEKTGEVRAVLSNDQGFFAASPLKPSTYTITAEKPGFSIVEYPQMPLAVGQELALDFEFRPAGVQENVTVVATAPVLDISSARVGATVSEREVQNLPVNGRQMSQLMLQAPGSQNAGDGTATRRRGWFVMRTPRRRRASASTRRSRARERVQTWSGSISFFWEFCGFHRGIPKCAILAKRLPKLSRRGAENIHTQLLYARGIIRIARNLLKGLR